MNKIHTDEISANAMGGSEIQAKYLTEHVSKDLLDKFQIVISRSRELTDKPKLFWAKETHACPEASKLRNPAFRSQFLRIIQNSDWCREKYHDHFGIPREQQHVLKNAIIPSKIKLYDKPLFQEKVKLIYSSTPQRGLSILYAVFDELYKEDKNIELNVYSSFDIYGHQSRNIPFLPLFEKCKNHPGINYYGSVSHDELIKATEESHILVYPCIYEESFCTTIMENMSALNLIVTNNFGALPETTAGFALTYDYTSDLQEHAKRFYHALKEGISVIRREKHFEGCDVIDYLNLQKEYVDRLHNWDIRGKQWTEFLQSLLEK